MALSLPEDKGRGHLGEDTDLFAVLQLVQDKLLVNLTCEIALEGQVLFVLFELIHALYRPLHHYLFLHRLLVSPRPHLSQFLYVFLIDPDPLLLNRPFDHCAQLPLRKALLHLIVDLHVIISHDPLQLVVSLREVELPRGVGAVVPLCELRLLSVDVLVEVLRAFVQVRVSLRFLVDEGCKVAEVLGVELLHVQVSALFQFVGVLLRPVLDILLDNLPPKVAFPKSFLDGVKLELDLFGSGFLLQESLRALPCF